MKTKRVSTHWQDALICKSPTYIWLDFINCASNWCCPFQQMKMIHFMNIWGKACHFTDEYPWIMRRETVFHLTVIYWASNQFVNKLSRMDSSPVSGGWFIFRLLVCRKCKGEQCCARKVRTRQPSYLRSTGNQPYANETFLLFLFAGFANFFVEYKTH